MFYFLISSNVKLKENKQYNKLLLKLNFFLVPSIQNKTYICIYGANIYIFFNIYYY